MFYQPCFIRNANKNLIYFISGLGYTPMYKTYRLNIEGNNLVLEGGTWHFTDSDNHPYCLDCGTNVSLFLALAALRAGNDKAQWFKENNYDLRVRCASLKFQFYKWENINGSWVEVSLVDNFHKATVQELIEHFNSLKE